MKFLIVLLFSSLCLAEVPITNLPSFTGSQVGSLDVVPFVNQASNTTGQILLSQWYQIPSLNAPAFLGALSAPSGTFTGIVTSPSGVFTNITFLRVPTSAYTNCGSISGAKGCVPVIIDGVAQKLPYF
jgi:hypothetical protein